MASMQAVNSAILKLNMSTEARVKQFKKTPKHKSINSLTKSSNIIKSYYKSSFNHCEKASVRIAILNLDGNNKLHYKLYKPKVFTRLNKEYNYAFMYLLNQNNISKYNKDIKRIFKDAHCEKLFIYMR